MIAILTLLLLTLVITQAITVYILVKNNNNTKKLVKLCGIGEKIASNIKFKPLMKEIMEIAKKETDAEAGSLYLVDEEKEELCFEIALGEKGDSVKEVRLKIGEGIAGWVAREGAVLNIRDVNRDTRFKKEIGRKIDFEQKAMLTVPVKFKEKTVGVLQLINKKGGGYFSAGDEELLEDMSNQIAVALENAKLYKAMHDLLVDSISSLASAVDAKDPYTNGHSKRVTEYSLEIAKEMDLSDGQLEKLEYMGLMHDVGKIGIRDSILNKQSQLSEEEFSVMKNHILIGAKILGNVKSLEEIIPGVRYHHEKYDGSGYVGLKGDNIPIEARIISVADTYDAMTTDRPYRKGLASDIAVKEINQCSGTQFDPKVVKNFNIIMQRRLDMKQ